MPLLLVQAGDHARDSRVARDSDRGAHVVPGHRRRELTPVDGVVDDIDLRRIGVDLTDVEIAHVFRGDHHAIGAGHQHAFGQDVPPELAGIDVDFGADDDRHALEDGGQPSVQAAGHQKRVHDMRPLVAEVPADAADVHRASNPRRQPEHVDRHAGAADLLADRSGLVNAADHRLEPLGQMPHEVQHHFLGAADHEGVRDVGDADPWFAGFARFRVRGSHLRASRRA